jgi:hypothetical protein
MQDRRKATIVQNIMDDRLHVSHLPAHEAVVAAHECLDRKDCVSKYRNPLTHPEFRVHKRGYSCGDWFAYRQTDEDLLDELA